MSGSPFTPFSSSSSEYQPYEVTPPHGAEESVHEVVQEAVQPDPRLLTAQQELQKAQAEIQKLTLENQKLSNIIEQKESEMKGLVVVYQQSIDDWRLEVKSHVATVLSKSISSLVMLSEVMDLAMFKRIEYALSELIDQQAVVVRVHPEQIERAKSLLQSQPQWKVIGDDKIAGGVVFETSTGVWDAQIGAAIEETEKLIQSWLSEGK
jgi:hypothetical protein